MSGPWAQFAQKPEADNEEASASPAPTRKPWESFKAGPATESPTPAAASVAGQSPPAVAKDQRPGFGETFVSAIQRGGASAIASTAHAVTDFVDQTVQYPVRELARAMYGKGSIAAEAGADPLGFRGAAESNLGIEQEINKDRQAAGERIGPRPTLAEAKADPVDAAKRYGLRLTNAAGESIPLLAAAVATRNPELGAGLMGGATGAQTFTDLRGEGIGRADAAQAAALTGAMEAAGEGIGLPAVMGKLGKGSLLRAAASEGAQEVPVQLGQQQVDDQVHGRETPVGDQLLDALDAGLVGAGLGGAGHLAGAQHGLGTSEQQAPQAAPTNGRNGDDSLSTTARAGNQVVVDHQVSAHHPEVVALRAQAAQLSTSGPLGRAAADVLHGRADAMEQLQPVPAEPGTLTDAAQATPRHTATQAGTVIDQHVASLQAAASDSRLDAQQLAAMTAERAQLDDTIRTHLRKREQGIAPADPVTERALAEQIPQLEQRRVELDSSLGRHRLAEGRGVQLQRLQERLGKIDTDAGLVELAGKLAPLVGDQNPIKSGEESVPKTGSEGGPWSRFGQAPQGGDVATGTDAMAAASEVTPPDGVPVMITKKMRADLAGRGYSGEQIGAMTPESAWQTLLDSPEAVRQQGQNDGPWALYGQASNDSLVNPSGFESDAPGAALDAAAAEAATSPTNDRPLPTDGQKDAGNYKKGSIKIAGLDISIENPAGTKRNEAWPALANHYGYIKGSIGKDKDHVDVFLTDKAEDTSLPVYVVDQHVAGKLDEHKVIMGATSAEDARATYYANYSKDFHQEKAGKVVQGAAAVTEMSHEQFKAWVRDPAATKKAASEVASEGATEVATENQKKGDLSENFDPFQQSPAGAGLRTEHAERLVRRFTKGMPNHPQVVLVDSAEALHEAAGVSAGSDSTRAEGIHNGKPAVFINTAAIDSPKRFRQVLAHEALGHFGVEQVVGGAWPDIAKTIGRHIDKGTGAPWMRRAIAQAQASQPDVTDPVKLAKEVIAVMAEQGSRNTLLGKVVARTRQTLRQAIPSVAWTEGDVRDLLSKAEGYLRAPKSQAASTTGGEAVDGPWIQYSKPGTVAPDTSHVAPQFGHVTNPQREALGKIATFQKREALPERAARLTDNLRAKVIQGTVDQFHAFQDLDPVAYMQARLSKGTDGTVEGVFKYGLPKLTDGALDIKPDGKGFLGHLQDLGGEHDLFLAWVAGHRSEQLASEGREHLFTGDDINALKGLAKGRMADGRSREAVYRTALKALNRYQSAVLDIAQEAGEINAASRARWLTDFYLPFFRDMDKSPATQPHPTRGGDNPGDIAEMRKQVIERLVGGGQPLNDLLENTLQNWSRLLGASMRNMAASRALTAAAEMGSAKQVPAADRGTVSAMFDGERKHFTVDDPLVLESLVLLYAPAWSNPAMKTLQWFKRALTFGVTIDPSFRVRNLLRDTMSVLAANQVGYNPLRNLTQGWKASERGSDTYLRLLGGGGAIRFGSLLDGDQARHAKRLITDGLATEDRILDTPAKIKAGLSKLWESYQEFGDRAETVNRAALYEQARTAGQDHLQASFAARDTMDFTNAGAWTAVQFLSRTVPFMNARLQGFYKLGRGAKQDPKRFASVTGAVALASVLLHLVNADDKDYRALPDWVRDTYWWIKLPGTNHALYVPKPFEIGAMASVVERGTELMTAGDDYNAQDFSGTLMSILSQQLSMNPVPQMFRPGMEAAFNWNQFQDRPIDGMGQERLPPGDRFTARTSGGAVALGKVTHTSPQRIEHLVRGYFGWLGVQALNASDLLTRKMLDLGSNPANDFTKVDNIAVIGSFIRERDAGSSKYVNRFYEQQKQVDMLYAAYAAARRAGDLERAQELAGDDRIKLRGLYQAADREMSKLSTRIRHVTSDKRLSSQAKSELLGGLYTTRDRLAQRTTERARKRK